MALTIHHLNCGRLHVPPGPAASCHCVLLVSDRQLALIDSGIGREDIARPFARIGRAAIEAAGFEFHEHLTAAAQIEQLGFGAADLRDIILTHADPDHAGGLADFPHARVHLAAEELAQIRPDAPRYALAQFDHGPHWVPVNAPDERWFGLESRRVILPFAADVRLIPLFGHTQGHCGVAVRNGERWLLHVGDAYYLRAELERDDHPISALAALRAADDARRRASLAQLRQLVQDHGSSIDLCGYHDFSEFPEHEAHTPSPTFG